MLIAINCSVHTTPTFNPHTDEEIVIPKGSDEKFVAKLNQIFDESGATKSVYFTRQRRSPMDFTVRHFAGGCIAMLCCMVYALVGIVSCSMVLYK